MVFISVYDIALLYTYKIYTSDMPSGPHPVLALIAGRRFHVHEYVGHPGQITADAIPHLLRDIVRRAHGDLGVDFQVQIDMILQSRLARETFFDAFDARDLLRHFANSAHHALIRDRKSTRLNSSHQIISYAVFCLKKKKKKLIKQR